MSPWLKALLGVEDSEIPPDAVTSFEFANLPRGSVGLLLLLAAAALVAGVYWIYRREGSAAYRSCRTPACPLRPRPARHRHDPESRRSSCR
jgi:hypothetical protein